MAWPDIVILLALAWGAFRGWRVGLIAELTGMIALLVAIAAAFSYGGGWDRAVAGFTHLGPGSAHVVALTTYAAAAYTVVAAIGFALGRFAKLPLVGTANAALGSALGFAKIAVFVWAVLYVALFFPLSSDLRHDLHRSWTVAAIESRNASLDDSLRSSLPPFVRPYADGIFARHRI